MTTLNVDLTFEQLLKAIRELPLEQQDKLWAELESELDHDEIRRRARDAVEAIWTANEGFTEDEVMADIETALREVRAERVSRRS